jgi:hypothetical protein
LETQKTQKLGWTVLPHSSYSPALALPDFYLFGALKYAIRGKKFGIVDEVIEEVKKWLRVQDSDWFSTRRGYMLLFSLAQGC